MTDMRYFALLLAVGCTTPVMTPAVAPSVVDDAIALDRSNLADSQSFDDPRVHFALNCGPRSCPLPEPEPFSVSCLDGELDQATRVFIHRKRNVSVDHATRTIQLSPIFNWYRADFVAMVRAHSTYPAPSIVDWLLLYADDALAADLLTARDRHYVRRYNGYDWRLNALGADTVLLNATVDEGSDVRETMPDIEFRSLDGIDWRPSQARGSVVLIAFWATWCRPCVRAFRRFGELEQTHASRDFFVVAAAQDERQEPVDAFVRANQLSINVVIDPDRSASEPPLSVVTIPTTLLLDRQGVVRHRHVGYSPAALDRLNDKIEQLLDEPPQ